MACDNKPSVEYVAPNSPLYRLIVDAVEEARRIALNDLHVAITGDDYRHAQREHAGLTNIGWGLKSGKLGDINTELLWKVLQHQIVTEDQSETQSVS